MSTAKTRRKKMNEDRIIIETMLKYGGGFAHALALAVAAQHADSENLARIKAGWPDYWKRYSDAADAIEISRVGEPSEN
jgi:hypothetical protein